MNWKVMARTFGLVFVAELGDKTQLATLSLSAGGSRWAVFAGSSLALVACSALAVLGGGRHQPRRAGHLDEARRGRAVHRDGRAVPADAIGERDAVTAAGARGPITSRERRAAGRHGAGGGTSTGWNSAKAIASGMRAGSSPRQ